MTIKTHISKHFPTENHMIAAERHKRILDLARREGTVRTTDLAREYDVTEETIRRDLELLTRKGRLRRIHGGAMDASAALTELPYTDRQARQLNEKISIAKEAALFLEPDETVLLDASSTALELASLLPLDMPIRVVTYSLAVVERLILRENVELVQLGGTYEPRGRRFSGILTETSLRSLRIDRFFYSGGGLDPRRGVSEPNHEQARLKKLMVQHSAWNCALIDHTKLGAQADYFITAPEEIHTLICDAAGQEYAREHLMEAPYDLRFSA